MISSQPMSLFELLSLITSFGGFALVLVSVIYLIRQTREITTQSKYVAKSLGVGAYQSLSVPVFEIDQLFISYPELRPYFYSGMDIVEEDPNYNRVISIAEYILDCFDVILVHSADLHAVHYPQEHFERYIVDSFANSPILCKHFKSIQTWYVTPLAELEKAGENQLQEATNKISQQPASSHMTTLAPIGSSD